MRTKDIIAELHKLDPSGDLVVSGIHFVERLESYYDGCTHEPITDNEGMIVGYRTYRQGPDKIVFHYMMPDDYLMDYPAEKFECDHEPTKQRWLNRHRRFMRHYETRFKRWHKRGWRMFVYKFLQLFFPMGEEEM